MSSDTDLGPLVIISLFLSVSISLYSRERGQMTNNIGVFLQMIFSLLRSLVLSNFKS